MHDIARRNHVVKIDNAHKGKISGICWSPYEENRLLSCGSDMSVKIWDTASLRDGEGDISMEAGPSRVQVRCAVMIEREVLLTSATKNKRKPVAVFNGKFAFKCVFTKSSLVFIH